MGSGRTRHAQRLARQPYPLEKLVLTDSVRLAGDIDAVCIVPILKAKGCDPRVVLISQASACHLSRHHMQTMLVSTRPIAAR
jgi:hypothetical protein